MTIQRINSQSDMSASGKIPSESFIKIGARLVATNKPENVNNTGIDA